MARSWLLTSTFYGNWLPGDPRGFVSRVRDRRPRPAEDVVRLEHDRPGTPCDADLPGLWRAAVHQMKGPRVRIDRAQADALANQFRETAAHRQWVLHALAVMANHIHLAVTVTDDIEPSDILGDFKSYGSRVLNARWGKRPNGTWWTQSGSKRKLPNERAISDAIAYIVGQEYPLVVWSLEVQASGGRKPPE
ncbi:transposase [Gemmata sp. JC717]|uniref:transposase n=1 Tax=Gemmata algarum TaxID=2975278 RepID=UPI0021BAC4D3|nr:transposase [Gemmata algarum]MDY3552403.1 transposase [Gemmata algarum]